MNLGTDLLKSILFNAHDIVLIITIYQCLLFVIFLLTFKHDRKLSHLLLAFFLLSQAAIYADNLINFGEAFNAYAISLTPDLIYLFGNAFWLESPLMLLYVRSMTYKNYQIKKTDLLYFLPFILFFIYHTSTWIMLDDAIQRAALTTSSISHSHWFDRTLYFLRENFRVICSLIALYELNKYQKLIKNEVSDTQGIDLNWLKLLVIGFLILRLSSLLISFGIISNFDFHIYLFDYESIGLTSNFIGMLLVSSLIYFSLAQSTFFRGVDLKLHTNKNVEKDSVSEEIVEHLLNYMSTNKPYLHHLLTLESLANQLNIPTKVLSNVINRGFKQNFFEFINTYRVDESKRLIEENKLNKVTMLEIMDKAGFNSKATFNTFFKKQVGMTPTEFKKSL